jgi:hypothetical protein
VLRRRCGGCRLVWRLGKAARGSHHRQNHDDQRVYRSDAAAMVGYVGLNRCLRGVVRGELYGVTRRSTTMWTLPVGARRFGYEVWWRQLDQSAACQPSTGVQP